MKSFGWELNAGIDFLEFKPSEIAAAVALYVSGEADVTQEKEVSVCLPYSL